MARNKNYQVPARKPNEYSGILRGEFRFFRVGTNKSFMKITLITLLFFPFVVFGQIPLGIGANFGSQGAGTGPGASLSYYPADRVEIYGSYGTSKITSWRLDEAEGRSHTLYTGFRVHLKSLMPRQRHRMSALLGAGLYFASHQDLFLENERVTARRVDWALFIPIFSPSETQIETLTGDLSSWGGYLELGSMYYLNEHLNLQWSLKLGSAVARQDISDYWRRKVPGAMEGVFFHFNVGITYRILGFRPVSEEKRRSDARRERLNYYQD